MSLLSVRRATTLALFWSALSSVAPALAQDEPPPGPAAAPPAVEQQPAPAVPAEPQAPAPAAAEANSAPNPALVAAAEGDKPDLAFEIQSLRDDQQGIQSDIENFKFQWQRERDLHTAITTRPLTINGVIQTRYGWIDQETSAPTVYARRSSFDIGAAILAFNGNLYRDYEDGRNLTYALRYGASPQTATNNSFLNLLDANITYSLLPTVDKEAPALTVTVGEQLLPFGLEVPATEELKPVIRNAEFTTALQLARRDIGLIVKGDLITRMDYGYNYRQALISYAFGVVNGAGPNLLDDNDAKDLIGRVAFTLPSDYHSWLRQVTIGGTVYYGKKNTYLTDMAKTLSGKGDKHRYGLDVYYNHWPFGVTYEYIVGRDVVTPGTTLADSGRTNVNSRSHTATFFLSFGEQFVSGFRNQGRYDDWWPKTYQPFVRYDSYKPNTDKGKNRIDTLTLGLNVFFAETTKLQLNYNRRDDQANPLGVSNEVLSQLQFGF